jgi:retron-type reverse transcriptase
MDPYLLAEALDLVIKNDGAPGVDGVTINSIENQKWDFIKSLAAEMKAKTFQPQAVRRVRIPKSDGRERPLGIPTLKDRVIQRALVLISRCRETPPTAG